MEHFEPHFKRDNLHALNFGTKKFKVFTLSDITNVSGTITNSTAFEAIESNVLRAGKDFPRALDVLPKHFNDLWQHALKLMLCWKSFHRPKDQSI